MIRGFGSSGNGLGSTKPTANHYIWRFVGKRVGFREADVDPKWKAHGIAGTVRIHDASRIQVASATFPAARRLRPGV
jgi:hypothetical protein